jgi:hypothetical protein
VSTPGPLNLEPPRGDRASVSPTFEPSGQPARDLTKPDSTLCITGYTCLNFPQDSLYPLPPPRRTPVRD